MKYDDVKWYKKFGQEVAEMFGEIQPQGYSVGRYSPRFANWSYEFKIVKFDGRIYEVMTRFGKVEGGIEISLPDCKGKAGL